MRKFILLVSLLLCFTGCSFLKIASAPFKSVKSTVPQSKSESKQVMKCRGEIEINNGVISCSEGFYFYEKGSTEQERNLNLKEKIAQFITRASGYLLILIIIGILLSASGFGWIVSAMFQGAFGLGRVLKQTVQGIQNARKNGTDLSTSLAISQDADVKKFIAEFKQKNNIK